MAETVRNPFFARMYMRMTARRNEEEEVHRRKTLAGLSGRVIEVGAGHGLNFALYPPEVTHVLAVEPEPTLRSGAVKAAAEASIPIEVVDGVASELPAPDESFDAAVASLVLCSVPDQRVALAEMYRVIRPGGELRFYEHVLADRTGMSRFQRFADATFWPHVGGGCHMARDTGPAIAEAGFEIQTLERFGFSPGFPVPALPHILGVARRG